MNSRAEAEQLLEKWITSENLRLHCRMVATAMEAYANELNKPEVEIEKWWQAGLLHDLDWEAYPDEHPNKAINEILPANDVDKEVIQAVRSHAPERTGAEPEAEIDRYLFACDEISGFMHAVSLMRPNGFEDMKPKSVKKKLKDSHFAANVPRDEIYKGAELIDKDLSDHINFMIEVFKKMG